MSSRSTNLAVGGLVAVLALAGCAGREARALSEEPQAGDPQEYEIVTLLPKDAIPSIDRPRFYSVAEANAEYEEDEVVIGVKFEGDARAYSVGLLSSHEIVNDTVGGRPIAVTW